MDSASLHLVEAEPLMQRYVYAVYPLRGEMNKCMRSCLKLMNSDLPYTLEEAEFS